MIDLKRSTGNERAVLIEALADYQAAQIERRENAPDEFEHARALWRVYVAQDILEQIAER